MCFISGIYTYTVLEQIILKQMQLNINFANPFGLL